ncbi:hypothetical protein, partial [Mesorhizobium sp.]|uniref:hypothetical protein n=1 Tax=Mesorhizobium sp. TaxID=1871066 RepID=UPI0025C57DEB
MEIPFVTSRAAIGSKGRGTDDAGQPLPSSGLGRERDGCVTGWVRFSFSPCGRRWIGAIAPRR